MIKINLLPVTDEVKTRSSPKGPPASIPRAIPSVFGVAIILLLGLYGVAHVKQSRASRTLSTTGQTLQELTESNRRATVVREGLPVLKKRADVFQTRLQERKVWSNLLGAIVLSCPEDIQLTEVSLTVPRGSASATHQSRELLIKGFYRTTENQENTEMIFASNLQKNKDLAVHYPRVLVAMTDPLPGRTDFSIRCASQ